MDDRAAQGLEHLQTAAIELIRAARTFLDVAEDVVVDRDKVAEVVGIVASVADAATRAARGEPPRSPAPAGAAASGDEPSTTASPLAGKARVERIEVQ